MNLQKTPWMRILISTGLVAFGILALVYSRGCNSSVRPRQELANKASMGDNLNTAMAELRKPVDGHLDVPRAFHYLNLWAEQGGTAVPNWKPTKLLETLPADLQEEDLIEDFYLERRDFPLSDYRHINASIWEREIVRWVAPRECPPEFQSWVKELGEKRGPDIEEQMRASLNLFDWVIRNIRLEPMLPPPPPPVAGAGGGLASKRAPFRAIPGPGYYRLPWQTLLFSRGDALQRGWVFLSLAKQVGVPGLMLGFETENNVGDPQTWCPALLIDGELYLFESEYGLPFLNESGEGVATLREVQENPKLLRQFDLPSIADYPVKATDLQRLNGMLVGDPETLSLRMAALEKALKGAQHLQLALDADQWETTLAKMKGFRRVRLWTIPWDSLIFYETEAKARQKNQQAMRDYLLQYQMYADWTPIMQGRQHHIRGNFETVDQEPSARKLYLFSRTSNRLLSLTSLNSKDEATLLTHAKEDATFFLALSHYEEGNYELAAEWFRDRIVDGAPDSPWVSAARYNLGRCLEAEGKPKLAREQYILDTESPQRLGNIVRSERLRARPQTEQPSADPTSSANATESDDSKSPQEKPTEPMEKPTESPPVSTTEKPAPSE